MSEVPPQMASGTPKAGSARDRASLGATGEPAGAPSGSPPDPKGRLAPRPSAGEPAAAEAEGSPGTVAALVVGLAGGLSSGLLGIGGGLVVVPLLAAWLGMPIKRAVGTSLVVVALTGAVGVAAESLIAPSNLRWAAAGLLAAGAMLGSWIGARAIARTPPRTLAVMMALVLVVAAARMAHLFGHVAIGAESLPAWARHVAHLTAGLGAGVIGSLFGVGGGILAVPALSALHPDWPFQACRATSLVMIVPTSILGAVLHRRMGNVVPSVARALAPGATVGSVLGVLLANSVPGRPLQVLFAVLLVISAVQLVRRSCR